ncbi:alpha/beta hydrolase [Pseudaestuariivita rosea]|uniref:alpha/beta hydrolase n=1 Tax=Pseudaestuariivita rosea TaxID=2763263 RepID=UPI001ABAF7BA|nr:alpha/beta hydrolase [Pseudaestuariivita rosea]
MIKTEHLRDWDDAYANMAYTPGAEKLPQLWSEQAAAYRASGVRIDQDIAYGDQPRERFDLVWPDGMARGLAVFVHGGYWMRFDKSYWTHLAQGARAKGWAVCLPSYTLTPEVRISQITQQIGQAIAAAADHVAGPIRLAGHSAGGHLVSRMICADTPLSDGIASRIEHTLSISGLHDLRLLLKTKMNEALQLDLAEATTESAALNLPNGNPHLTCWVGSDERPEFIRQARIMAQMWDGLDAVTKCVVEDQHDHFSIIEGLTDPDSPITTAFVGG